MFLAIFLHNLSPHPLWSTSWFGALHLIFHTFLQKLNLNLNQHTSLKTAHMCAHHLCTTVIHNTAQNSSDIFPLILQTAIIAQMLSTGDGERKPINNLRCQWCLKLSNYISMCGEAWCCQRDQLPSCCCNWLISWAKFSSIVLLSCCSATIWSRRNMISDFSSSSLCSWPTFTVISSSRYFNTTSCISCNTPVLHLISLYKPTVPLSGFPQVRQYKIPWLFQIKQAFCRTFDNPVF